MIRVKIIPTNYLPGSISTYSDSVPRTPVGAWVNETFPKVPVTSHSEKTTPDDFQLLQNSLKVCRQVFLDNTLLL